MNKLNPLRVGVAVQLLLEGASVREASDRSGVYRQGVTRIAAQLDGFDGELFWLPKRRKCIRTTSGREVLHEELLLALVKKTAVAARGKEAR